MPGFKDLRVGTKLGFLVGVVLVGFAVFFAFAMNGLGQVKVSGPIYTNIVMGKDLIADILPPPAYIIETYLTCFQILQKSEAGNQAAQVSELIAKTEKLRQDFETRHAYWLQTLPESEMKQEMLVTSYEPAVQFFKDLELQFIPAIQKGDLDSATLILNETLTPLYEQHRQAVDRTVVMSTEKNATFEASAAQTVSQTNLLLIGIAVLAAAISIAISVVIVQGITGSVSAMLATARDIARGNLSNHISLQSKDEIGQLADAFRGMVIYLQEIASTARQIANNDLTPQITPKSEQDELGMAFVTMLRNLRQSLVQIAENADGLSAAAAQLADTANQAGQATTDIAVNIQQVAKGSAEQAQSVNSTSEAVQQMNHTIDGVAQGAQEQASSVGQASKITTQINSAITQISGNTLAVTRESDSASEAARKGSQTVQETIAGMQAIKTKVDLSVQKVQEMGKRSDQIGVIVEAIDDIASQTNLLALNAAIEAARAGEQGKGFAIVADEVRKLAERASSSTKEIGALIKAIQTSVAEAVNAMNESAREVEFGVVRANSAGQALTEILRAAEAVYTQSGQAAAITQRMTGAAGELASSMTAVDEVVRQNAAATAEMAASANEVARSIVRIAAISEDNTSAIEQVSASAEEMSAQVEEVTASAHELSSMALNLQEIVAAFILEDEAPQSGRPAQNLKPPAMRSPAAVFRVAH